MQQRTGLLSLPLELLEAILALCSASGHVTSVAAAAQTCRQLRMLIYDAVDDHLWRMLFLSIFDDPRHLDTKEFDWRGQLTERVRVRAFIHRNAQVLQHTEVSNLWFETRFTDVGMNKLPGIGDLMSNYKALAPIVSVIRTAAPLTPSPERPRLQDAPLTQLHAQTPMFPPPFSPHNSLNVAWLVETFMNGLPFMITRILTLDSVDLPLLSEGKGKAVGQLTSYLGFLPSRVVEEEDDSAGHPVTSKPPSNYFIPSKAQHERARRHLHQQVFTMSYLSPRRNWGPYVKYPPKSTATDDNEDKDEVEGDEDVESDDDYVDHTSDDTSVSSSETAPPENHNHGPGRWVSLLPPLEHLYPDWAWLAAARIIAECTLRANVDAEDVKSLVAWDNLRAGAWGSSRKDEEVEGAPIEVGSASESRLDTFERDWAGVEGMWRRLVCWLDYDYLYNANYTYFHDSNLEEAWIIVPLSLRITGYSAPSVAVYPDRPTIHVEGEMGGAEWVGSVEPGHDNDVRRVHGTVSMLPDGSVRYSITSMSPGSVEDEWTSEAVQLGGVGSAMGSLGMWTAVTHQSEDPLGVIWQWRVG